MWKDIILLIAVSTVNGIVLSPSNITSADGHCHGDLGCLLCNCFNDTVTIDLQLTEGNFNLTGQSSCLLINKTNISISGQRNDTQLICYNFSIVIFYSNNITIENLRMINCGHFIDQNIRMYYDIVCTELQCYNQY